MANWSDRRFQTLIYPEAATASRKADEEKARGFPCRLDVPKSHHHEAEYTDAVQTRSHAIEFLHNRRESIYGYMAAISIKAKSQKFRLANGGGSIYV
jgi:hypothetical protein